MDVSKMVRGILTKRKMSAHLEKDASQCGMGFERYLGSKVGFQILKYKPRLSNLCCTFVMINC